MMLGVDLTDLPDSEQSKPVWRMLEARLIPWSSALGETIVIRLPENNLSPVEKVTNTLFIKFFCRPAGQEYPDRTIVSEIYHLPKDSFEVSGIPPTRRKDAKNICDQRGRVVAQVLDGNIYIPFQLYRVPNAGLFLDKIMESYADLRFDGEQREAVALKLREARRTTVRERYAAWRLDPRTHMGTIDKQLAENRGEQKKIAREFCATQSRIFDKIGIISGLTGEITAVQAQLALIDARSAVATMEQLLNHPSVAEVTIDVASKSCVIATRPLVTAPLRDGRQRHIEPLEVALDMQNGRVIVRLLNRSFSTEKAHPYAIESNELWCGTGTAIYRALGERNAGLAGLLILDHLTNVDEDDPFGRLIVTWPTER